MSGSYPDSDLDPKISVSQVLVIMTSDTAISDFGEWRVPAFIDVFSYFTFDVPCCLIETND